MSTLEIESEAFAHEGSIPPRYTCDGDDVSPPLTWSAGPQGTVGYALICDDPDAPVGTWVHWVAWNVEETGLPEALPTDPADPTGARGLEQGTNSWGRTGYGGPCPPSGTHRYYFRVYALDERLELPASTDADGLRRALEGHVLAEGELLGRYARS